MVPQSKQQRRNIKDDRRNEAACCCARLWPDHKGFHVQTRDLTAEELEAEIKLITRNEKDAYDTNSKMKEHITSVKDLPEAHPEMQGILETANA